MLKMLNVEDAQTTTREAISFGYFCFESFESFGLLHVNHYFSQQNNDRQKYAKQF